MKRNRRCVSKVFVLVFMLSAMFFATSCATTGGAKAKAYSYFSDENAKARLKPEYKINFRCKKQVKQIAFSKDGKTLLLPPYQEVEKVFGYSEREIACLNDDTGNPLWYRMNAIIDGSKFGAHPVKVWNNKVLSILYLADFINTYKAKCPAMINMDNAPEWFKKVLEERKGVVTLIKAAYISPAQLFTEANGKMRLSPNYKIDFTIQKKARQIAFSKDGKNLIIPSYKKAEKVFNYNRDQIKILTTGHGDLLWYRLEKIIDDTKTGIIPFTAASMYHWDGCVLYSLYLADFINTYQAKCPQMINMTNAPKWFKNLCADRKGKSGFIRSKDQMDIQSLEVKITPKNKSILISWSASNLLSKVVIDYSKEETRDVKKTKTLKNIKENYILLDGLENYKAYEGFVKFFDKNGKEAKSERLYTTTRTGDNNIDYVKTPADFKEVNGDKFLPAKYRLSVPWKFGTKMRFSKNGKSVLFIGKVQKAEKIFKFTHEELKYDDFPIWGRLSHVIDGNVYANSAVNNRGGNVYWILCLVDLFNVYRAKCPELVDLSNAPKWFTELMAERKKSGKSLAKRKYR